MWVSLPSACLVSCCLSTFCVTVKAFTIREKRKKMMPRSTSKSMAVTRLRLLSRPRQDSETEVRIYRDRGCVSFLLWHTFAHTLAQRFSELKMLSVSSMWTLMTKKILKEVELVKGCVFNCIFFYLSCVRYVEKPICTFMFCCQTLGALPMRFARKQQWDR